MSQKIESQEVPAKSKASIFSSIFTGSAYVYAKYGPQGFVKSARYVMKRLFGPFVEPQLIKFSEQHRGTFTKSQRTTILIPTRDKIDLLIECVNSIFANTDPALFDLVVIDNGSKELRSLKYLQEIAQIENVSVLRADEPFNYSKLNNRAAQSVSTQYLCLLNNDTVILEKSWLTNLTKIASGVSAGAVGALLVYEDKQVIQHAGVVVGSRGIAKNYLAGRRIDDSKADSWLRENRQVDAVTGACLLIETKKFEQVGGWMKIYQSDLMTLTCASD